MPKSRAHKKISSGEGLFILKNWQTHKTVLWFVSFEYADIVGGPDVRVKSASPALLELQHAGSEEVIWVDLGGMDFWLLAKSDVPFPANTLEGFDVLLGMRRSDSEIPLLLASRIIIN
jgi:hypothetical protein